MGYIKIEKYQLFFEEQLGEDPGVLILPSSGLGRNQWSSLFQLIPDRLSYVLSYLNYPPSDLWIGSDGPDFNIDLLAAEKVLNILYDKGGRPVDLVGHSYGGFLALSLAKKYPDKIRRLALFEPIAWGVLRFDSQNQMIKRNFEKLCQKLFYQSLIQDDWLCVFLDFWNHEGFWVSLSSKSKDYWRKIYPKVYSEVKGLCFDNKNLSYWKDIKHPIRILRGKSGPKEELEVCKLLREGLENSELIETVGGHMAPITHHHKMIPFFADWL